MVGIRTFSGTLVAFVGAAGLAWLNRTWLLGFWLSPMLESASGVDLRMHVQGQAALVALTIKVTVATAVLLTLPVFYAEAWLLICRMTRREQARRLTVPFSVVSTGAALIVLALIRRIELIFFAELLPQPLPGAM